MLDFTDIQPTKLGGPQPNEKGGLSFDDLKPGSTIQQSLGEFKGPHGIDYQRSLARKTAESEQKVAEATSLSGMIKTGFDTVTSLAPWKKLGADVAESPLQYAAAASTGALSGLTLGTSDWAMQQLLENKDKFGLSQQTIDNLNYALKPTDANGKDITDAKSATSLATSLVPYAAIDNTVRAGVKYASKSFLTKYAALAPLLSEATNMKVLNQTYNGVKALERGAIIAGDIGANVASGQLIQSMLPKEERNRGMQAGIDVAAAGLFGGAAPLLRKVNNTIFKRGLGQIDELTGNILDKEGRVIIGDTNIITAKGVNGEDIRISTKDQQDLENFIKGSSDKITYEKSKDFGYDSQGRKIAANISFDKDGSATVRVFKGAQPEDIAHELGHFYDTTSGDSVSKLSELLKDPVRNIGELQDTLGAYAVSKIDGTATPSLINKVIKQNADKITESIETLTKDIARTEGKASEQFAEAVAQIVTKPGLAQEHPEFVEFLQFLERNKNVKLFGDFVPTGKIYNKNLSKYGNQLREEAAFEKAGRPQKSTVTIDQDEISAKRAVDIYETEARKERISAEIKRAKAEIKLATTKAQGIRARAIVKNLENKSKELTERIKAQRATVKAEIKAEAANKKAQVLAAKKLERTPTGKQPKTAPINAKAITQNEEAQKAVETVASSVTGKYRIGKNNKDIIERSYNSKLTEPEFNQILTERFGNLSEDVMKAKRFMVDGALDLKNKLAGRTIDSLPDAEKKALLTQYNQVVETFEVFSGVRTELSNSFRTLGIDAQPGENALLGDALKTIQDIFKDESDPFKIAQKLASTRMKGGVEKYFDQWFPLVLSGPKTHLRNIFGNLSNLVLQTAASAFTKQGLKELGPRLKGMRASHKNAVDLATAIMKLGRDAVGEGNKYFDANPAFLGNLKGAIENKKLMKTPVEYSGLLERLGAGWTSAKDLVNNSLSAQDAYFRELAKGGEQGALKKAAIKYTDDAVIDKAIDASFAHEIGLRTTFQNSMDESVVGELAKKIAGVKSSKNSILKAGAYLLTPFVRTVANLTDRRIDFVPIINSFRTFQKNNHQYEAIAQRIVKNAHGVAQMTEAQKGVAVKAVQKRLVNQQMGRFTMGIGATALGMSLAAAGNISGAGPKDKTEREVLQKTGWRPNSINIGGMWVPYQNLALPLAAIFSVVGNIGDAIHYGETQQDTTDMVLDGLKRFMSSELDQSFLSGINNVVDFANSYKSFPQFASEMAANAIPIPAVWTQTFGGGGVFNPDSVIANTFTEQIKKRLGFTDGLEPRLDSFGNPVKADLIYGLTPALTTSSDFPFIEKNYVQDDAVLNFMKDNGVFVGKPSLSQKIKGTGDEERKMTSEEYTAFVQESGDKIYKIMESKINNGQWDTKTQKEIKKEISSITSDIRAREKNKIKF